MSTACPERDDGCHCECWRDGEPCCHCSFAFDDSGEADDFDGMYCDIGGG